MLYYKATASCGAGFFVGVSVCKRTAPVALILVSRAAGCCRPRCRPSPLLRHPLHAHWTHPYSLLRRPPPPRIVSTLLSCCAAPFSWASHHIRPRLPHPTCLALHLHTPPSHPLSSQEQHRPTHPSASLQSWLHGPAGRRRYRRRLPRCGVGRVLGRPGASTESTVLLSLSTPSSSHKAYRHVILHYHVCVLHQSFLDATTRSGAFVEM